MTDRKAKNTCQCHFILERSIFLNRHSQEKQQCALLNDCLFKHYSLGSAVLRALPEREV